MKWKVEHEALRSALRAQGVSPHLLRRLSLEKIEPDEALLGRTRDWIVSLKDDPGWPILERNLTQVNAFPDAFHQASQLGFSPRSDHHHALIFEFFARKFLEKNDFKNAHYAIVEWYRAWCRLSRGDYISRLVESVAADLSEDEIAVVSTNFLADIFPDMVAQLNDPGGVRTGFIDLNSLGFLAKICRTISADEAEVNQPHIKQLRQSITQTVPTMNAKVATKFIGEVEALDLDQGEADALTKPFQYVRDYFEIVGLNSTISQSVITRVVSFCWDLRRLDRDEIPAFSAVLKICEFFNQDLINKLLADSDSPSFGTEAFGHNSTCSDFLVFKAEQLQGAPRRLPLELGLKICPGHRNCSVLLSYEYLRDVDEILLKTAPIPSARMMIKWGKSSVIDLLNDAEQKVRDAEDLHPVNKSLEKYKKRVRNEKARFGL